MWLSETLEYRIQGLVRGWKRASLPEWVLGYPQGSDSLLDTGPHIWLREPDSSLMSLHGCWLRRGPLGPFLVLSVA